MPSASFQGWATEAMGRILFVSSLAAFTGGIVGAHYAAAKSGLHGLTHFLAARFAADGVTVNTIAPALVEDTGMLPGSPDELRSIVPVGRLGRSAEVADLAVAMLSNAYLTSKVIGLDGGISSAVALLVGRASPAPTRPGGQAPRPQWRRAFRQLFTRRVSVVWSQALKKSA